MIEKWKTINGYPDYQVSNFGRIKSYKRSVPCILNPYLNGGGYLMITLSGNDGKKRKMVHRLVAKAFISNPNNYKIVHHKDSDRSNAHVSNLEWCTQAKNIRYAFLEGKMNGPNKPVALFGEDHPNSKLTEKRVIDIRRLYKEGVDKKKIAEKHNIHVNSIRKIVNKESWKHVS